MVADATAAEALKLIAADRITEEVLKYPKASFTYSIRYE